MAGRDSEDKNQVIVFKASGSASRDPVGGEVIVFKASGPVSREPDGWTVGIEFFRWGNLEPGRGAKRAEELSRE